MIDLNEKLDKLNQQAQEKAYTMDDMDWSKDIDFTKQWSPESMGSLYYLPSYNLLTKEHKLRYTQMFAMSICEQFIWLEEILLRGILLQKMKDFDDDPKFKKALEFFLEEEEKHSAYFWKILQKAHPEWYPEKKFKIYKIRKSDSKFFDLISKHSGKILVWIWLALFFEERTMDYSIRYQKAYKGNEEDIDFNFWQVHYFHMLDETRHHQMDEIFLEKFYNGSSSWKRKLAGWMFTLIMKSYVAPKRNANVILDMMKEEFPELGANGVVEKLRAELPLLKGNKEFQDVYFSKSAVGKTMSLLSRYPEFDRVWELFVNYKKSDFN
jgi:hypothetical protein